ncbi:MAG: hypothetical protein ACRC9P_05375, partial [Bacteroides sp.]
IHICDMMGYMNKHNCIKYIYRKLGYKGISSQKRNLDRLSPIDKKRAYHIVLSLLDERLPKHKGL